MSDIPARLECSYCIRHQSHGGECYMNISSKGGGCLAFKQDPKGCIRNTTKRLKFPLYRTIPRINEWESNWQVNGVDSAIRIKKIRGIDWDVKQGMIEIIVDIDYYVNEYSEDYKTYSKPDLKIVE